jgi:hypothetical protein
MAEIYVAKLQCCVLFLKGVRSFIRSTNSSQYFFLAIFQLSMTIGDFFRCWVINGSSRPHCARALGIILLMLGESSGS